MWRDLGLHEPRTVAGAVAVGLDVPAGEVTP